MVFSACHADLSVLHETLCEDVVFWYYEYGAVLPPQGGRYVKLDRDCVQGHGAVPDQCGSGN